MKQFDRCVVHIGTEKTGTSSLQLFLSSNREAFAKEGVLYPQSSGRHGGSQWGFVAAVHDKPWVSDLGSAHGIGNAEEQEVYAKKLKEGLTREIDAFEGQAATLLISSEHCHSRLKSVAEIERLKAFLAPFTHRFEIILYLRRQDRVAVSFYSTKVKSGQIPPAVFLPSGKAGDRYYYNYEQVYRNWVSAFGKESVKVRLFDRSEFVGGDLFVDFCSVTGLSLAGKRVPDPVNESLNAKGLAFLLEVNKQFAKPECVSTNVLRESIRKYVYTHCRGACQLASREEAAMFYGEFEESNERLRTLAFPGRDKPLFDKDFSAYPEDFVKLPRRYSDAVSIAIAIFSDAMHTLKADQDALRPATEESSECAQGLLRLQVENLALQAVIARNNKNDARAERLLRNAVELLPDHFKANLELARLLLSTGGMDEGIERLRIAVRVGPPGSPGLRSLLEKYGRLLDQSA